MKSPKILLLPGLMLGIALLFAQCKQVVNDTADQQIPYDKEKAKIHIISIKDAAELASTFREGRLQLNRQLKDTAFLNKSFNLPIAEAFNRDAIAALLNQKGARGVRIYLGEDKKGLIRLVLIAVDEKGNDIIGKNGRVMKYAQDDGGDPFGLESGQRCPTLCSVFSGNGDAQ
jgi:hypothetical protein